MPQIRDYVVTQTRKVRVRCNTMMEAHEAAKDAFDGEPVPQQTHISVDRVEEVSLAITEQRNA